MNKADETGPGTSRLVTQRQKLTDNGRLGPTCIDKAGLSRKRKDKADRARPGMQ